MVSAFLHHLSSLENNPKSFEYDHKVLRPKLCETVLEGEREKGGKGPLRRWKSLAVKGRV